MDRVGIAAGVYTGVAAGIYFQLHHVDIVGYDFVFHHPEKPVIFIKIRE